MKQRTRQAGLRAAYTTILVGLATMGAGFVVLWDAPWLVLLLLVEYLAMTWRSR